MYRVSEKFRQQAYSGEALYTANLSINGQSVPNEQIASIVISDPIIDDSVETFYLGSFISKQITIKFKNLDGLNIYSGGSVYLEIGQEIDGEYEDVPIGHFLIDELDENYFTTCEITCLDYAILFKPNVDYSPVFNDGKATIDEILEWLCRHFGVTLGNYPKLNGNVEIGVYDGSISGKQWISYIAEIKGCNAKIDRDGVLQFIPFNNSSTVTINALESEEWELGEKYKISQIVYFDALRNYTYGDETENTLYIRQDNPFVTDTTVIENIYENIFVTSKEVENETISIDDGSDAHNGKLTILGNTYQEVETGDGGLETVGNFLDVEEIDTNKVSQITLKGNTQQNTTEGKNLLDISDVTTTGIITNNGDGSITLNGKGSGGVSFTLTNSFTLYANTTYTLSVSETFISSSVATFILRNGSTNIMEVRYSEGYVTYTPTENITIDTIRIYLAAATFDNYTFFPQLEIGNKATEFEPYTHGASPNPDYPQNIQVVKGLNTININQDEYEVNLGNIELCQIGQYQDYLYKQNGNWYKHKEISKMVLNGSEEWGKNNTRFSINLSDYDNGAKPILCTHFIPTDDFGYHNTHNYTIILFKDEQWSYARISINDNDFSTTSDFKNWLSSNNVIVYLPLPNYVDEQITDNTLISQLDALYNATIYEEVLMNSTTQNALPYIDLKYNIVIPTPSIEKPSEIKTVTGEIVIVNKSQETDPESSDYHYDEYTVDLGNIELLKLGDVQDRIYLEGNKWYYTNYFTKINSYNGETIETNYISSTGGLDIGATIYYFDINNQPIEIPTEELYQQLNAINNMTMYNGSNIIETTTNNQNPILNLKYFLALDFTLWSLRNKNYGDISLDGYDVIDFTLGEDENHNLIHYYTYNNNVTTYEMNISTEINTQIPNKQKEVTTNHIGGDIPTRVKMLKTNLDHVNNEIELLVEEQSEQDRKINQTIIDINSTRNIFQITGGSNLIKNSQFLYDDPIIEEEGGESHRTYWDLENNGNLPFNNLGDGYDPSLIGQTVSLAKIQLRDTILTSRDLNISDLQVGQTYTLNYYYRQDDLTTTRLQLIDGNNEIVKYVIINEETGEQTEEEIDITYDSEENRITNETFQFIATTSNLTFKVTTSTTSGTDGYFYLYDLMLNSGDKKAWELASSEIYSTTIQMSNLGLQVITSDEDIATLLTSQGFQVVEYDNGRFGAIVTQFTKKGIKTGDIESNSVATGKYVMTEITISNTEHHVEYFID